LDGKQSAVQPLLDYLQLKNTKSFIILVNGRIVLENYFNGHDAMLLVLGKCWKTLTSTVTGIAQQENLIDIKKKSQYIEQVGLATLSQRKLDNQQALTQHDFRIR
jgi:hypothetical protein